MMMVLRSPDQADQPSQQRRHEDVHGTDHEEQPGHAGDVVAEALDQEEAAEGHEELPARTREGKSAT